MVEDWLCPTGTELLCHGETNDKQMNRYQGLPFIDANCVLGMRLTNIDVSCVYSFSLLHNSFYNPGQHVALILKVTQSVGSGARIRLWQGLSSLSF